MTLLRIAPDEFARRLRAITEQTDKRFAFFLGAGCSVSSGIPAAGALVKDVWLPRLRELRAPDRTDLDSWATEQFPGYDPDGAAASYGEVMNVLFLNNAEERQREVERLCDGCFPGFGYAALAALMALGGGCFNVALTTNFDDLVADALYLFTSSRPLVIPHESLANYIRSTRMRPLVVKLHGDHRLSPQSTAHETGTLKQAIETRVRSLLHDRGLIFIGYGGNDFGITAMLDGLPMDALPLGVYWVASSECQGQIGPWLEKRQAVWVEHRDFDELMVLVKDVFGLQHPDRSRFVKVFDAYFETYDSLSGRIASSPETKPDAPALKAAVERIDRSFTDWWAVELAARRLKTTNPEEADGLYQQGLKQFPNRPELLGSYAIFLHETRKDPGRAEELYRRAIEADPNHATNLGNYAIFLQTVRKDPDRAEEMYRPAIEADPNHATNLGNYAIFLQTVRKDPDRAEEMYRRAIEADPNHANNLGGYASFLQTVRKDPDRAEEMYRRAIEADPNHANNLGNCALFLQAVRKDPDRAEEMYRRAIEADPNRANNLGNYALFLKNGREDPDRAEEMYRRAIEADPNHANNLGGYASFLQTVRKDPDRAEEMYRRAIEADPNDANSLANLAGILLGKGCREEGLSLLSRTLALPALKPPTAITAECWFYAFAHRRPNQQRHALNRLKEALVAGARSPGWDLSANVSRAREDGHPDAEWLDELVQVIAGGADISVLEPWDKWHRA